VAVLHHPPTDIALRILPIPIMPICIPKIPYFA